jgi:hypothetical protein
MSELLDVASEDEGLIGLVDFTKLVFQLGNGIECPAETLGHQVFVWSAFRGGGQSVVVLHRRGPSEGNPLQRQWASGEVTESPGDGPF